jgi:hypothetical protein
MGDWFAVRCVFGQVGADDAQAGRDWTYEERITLWEASGPEEASSYAEDEARRHADFVDAVYLGSARVYALNGPPGSGSEIYALLRGSELGPDDYVRRFVDTGRELPPPR